MFDDVFEYVEFEFVVEGWLERTEIPCFCGAALLLDRQNSRLVCENCLYEAQVSFDESPEC